MVHTHVPLNGTQPLITADNRRILHDQGSFHRHHTIPFRAVTVVAQGKLIELKTGTESSKRA